MSKTTFSVLIATVIAIVAVVGLFLTTTDSKFGEKKRTFSDLGGDFTLDSKKGPISLTDYRGKVVILYFGFLTCPEVCPNSMAVVKNALNKLTAEQLRSTRAILVSVDPRRDSLDDLAEFASFYHDNLVGVTGSQQQIKRITDQYGAYYDIEEIGSIAQDYGIEHSSRYYVIGPDGNLIAAMRHSTTPNELRAQIAQVLNGRSET